jgi:hypothetical protein
MLPLHMPVPRFRYAFPVFCCIAVVSVLLYLGFSYAGGFLGFPLDDAWIHQTYARNLARRGEFAFVPGQPSAGSTSPLWSGLLALGYVLKIDYRLWTYTLGAALLGLNAWLAYRLVLQRWPSHSTAAWLAGIFIALEWHMVWAAASGMETLLFAALALAAFVIPTSRAAWLGIAMGMSVLARPDGLTLLPFVMARLWLQRPFGPGVMAASPSHGWRALTRALVCGLGFGVIFGLYLAFNYRLSGSIWPNTFYAKQAEYAVLRQLPVWARAIVRCGPSGACEPGLALLPFVGPQALLVPGLGVAVWQSITARRWEALAALGWVVAFVAAYVLRLPVTYQHGRYLMPVIPVLIAVGAGGTAQWLRLNAPRVAPRVIGRTWLGATGLVLIIFWAGIGARAYAGDVQFIETEMVATARWVNQNTSSDDLIAAHDIGALGYFGGRRLLDMAGLVSPEVIPFIRDQGQLRDWLTRAGADYLVTFPDWYPALTAPLAEAEVFRTHASYSPQIGGSNMAVYRWPALQP